MNQLEYYRTHPPRCLSDFYAEPVDIKFPNFSNQSDDLVTKYKVSCQCGHDNFQVLGHNWQNPDTGVKLFISPLTLKCESCAQETPLFDIGKHGYNGEQGDLYIARGQGTPELFECKTCGPAAFEIFTRFEYPDDLFEEEEFKGHEEDFFVWFTTHGRCSTCSKLLEVTDYKCT